MYSQDYIRPQNFGGQYQWIFGNIRAQPRNFPLYNTRYRDYRDNQLSRVWNPTPSYNERSTILFLPSYNSNLLNYIRFRHSSPRTKFPRSYGWHRQSFLIDSSSWLARFYFLNPLGRTQEPFDSILLRWCCCYFRRKYDLWLSRLVRNGGLYGESPWNRWSPI